MHKKNGSALTLPFLFPPNQTRYFAFGTPAYTARHRRARRRPPPNPASCPPPATRSTRNDCLYVRPSTFIVTR